MAPSESARVAHVWRRLGFGPRPGDVQAGLDAGGAGAVVDELLARPTTTEADWHWPTETGAWDDAIRWHTRLFENWAQSPGQVQERVSWILTGLLVCGMNDVVGYPEMKQHHTRLRQWHAAPSYKSLLREVAHTAPMQKYLTNVFSVPPHPNENLARELMELFSLGVTNPRTGAANYTEADVKEIARALTGYLMDWTTGEVSHVPAYWDAGAKTFLGAARGAAKLDEVVDAIVAHESFKYFVPQHMYRELIGANPSAAAMDEMAGAWGTDGNLRALIAHIVRRPEFLADATINNRVKSPVELLVSQMRVLGLQDATDWSLWWTSGIMRQNPWLPPDVSGWANLWLHPTHLIVWARLNFWFCVYDRGPAKDGTAEATPVTKQSPTVRRLFAEATRTTAAGLAFEFAGLHDVSPQSFGAVDTFARAAAWTGEPWTYERACGVMQMVFDSPEFLVS